jgi:hypothetical protein
MDNFPFCDLTKLPYKVEGICCTWGSKTLLSAADGDVTDAVLVESTVGSSLG